MNKWLVEFEDGERIVIAGPKTIVAARSFAVDYIIGRHGNQTSCGASQHAVESIEPIKAIDSNQAYIKNLGRLFKVSCDRQCDKAWGRSVRALNQRSENESDWEYLADHELPMAPADPGSVSGGCSKPASPNDFPNAWCINECERCAMSKPGEYFANLEQPNFTKRLRNLANKIMCKLEDGPLGGSYIEIPDTERNTVVIEHGKGPRMRRYEYVWREIGGKRKLFFSCRANSPRL